MIGLATQSDDAEMLDLIQSKLAVFDGDPESQAYCLDFEVAKDDYLNVATDCDQMVVGCIRHEVMISVITHLFVAQNLARKGVRLKLWESRAQRPKVIVGNG